MLIALILFVSCTLLSVIIIHFAIMLANVYRIADHPGEHKQHNISIPFVGGVGVFAALCIGLIVLSACYPDSMQRWLVLGLCSTIIFVTGFKDDISQLTYKVRIGIQIIVALIIVLVGGIVLKDLGGLFFGLVVVPSEWFAILFTIFAITGGINIINMIDGVDGLSGSLSLASLLLLGCVAYAAGDLANLFLIAALTGGVAGFLNYNLRRPSWDNARVFLGDNGSMLLGLLFAWLLVDLAQEPGPAMRPVTAVWLLSIPLMDAVSVMHRRLLKGVSPFRPDRNHLHHLLLRAGYRVEEVVFAIVSLHLLMGITGLVGLYWNVPDFVMLLGFLLAYIGYFYLTLRPWYYIPALCFLHTRLRLTPNASRGTFNGSYTVRGAENLALRVSEKIRSRVDFWVQIYKQPSEGGDTKQRYALALYIRLPKDQHALNKIERYITLLQQRMRNKRNIQLRQLVARNDDSNWNSSDNVDNFGELHMANRRIAFRRGLGAQVLVFEATWMSVKKSHYVRK